MPCCRSLAVRQLMARNEPFDTGVKFAVFEALAATRQGDLITRLALEGYSEQKISEAVKDLHRRGFVQAVEISALGDDRVYWEPLGLTPEGRVLWNRLTKV